MSEARMRQTPQKKAIQRVFSESGRPLTVQEVHELAKAYVPNIGIATIYRRVKRMTESGWLQPVELPGEVVRYEPSHLHEHHHFACKECKLVFDVRANPDNVSISLPNGFKLERHELFLYGVCVKCA